MNFNLLLDIRVDIKIILDSIIIKYKFIKKGITQYLMPQVIAPLGGVYYFS